MTLRTHRTSVSVVESGFVKLIKRLKRLFNAREDEFVGISRRFGRGKILNNAKNDEVHIRAWSELCAMEHATDITFR